MAVASERKVMSNATPSATVTPGSDCTMLSAAQLDRLNNLTPAAGERHDEICTESRRRRHQRDVRVGVVNPDDADTEPGSRRTTH